MGFKKNDNGLVKTKRCVQMLDQASWQLSAVKIFVNNGHVEGELPMVSRNSFKDYHWEKKIGMIADKVDLSQDCCIVIFHGRKKAILVDVVSPMADSNADSWERESRKYILKQHIGKMRPKKQVQEFSISDVTEWTTVIMPLFHEKDKRTSAKTVFGRISHIFRKSTIAQPEEQQKEAKKSNINESQIELKKLSKKKSKTVNQRKSIAESIQVRKSIDTVSTSSVSDEEEEKHNSVEAKSIRIPSVKEKAATTKKTDSVESIKSSSTENVITQIEQIKYEVERDSNAIILSLDGSSSKKAPSKNGKNLLQATLDSEADSIRSESSNWEPVAPQLALEYVFTTPELCALFEKYIAQQHAEENLLFYRAIEYFKNHDYVYPNTLLANILDAAIIAKKPRQSKNKELKKAEFSMQQNIAETYDFPMVKALMFHDALKIYHTFLQNSAPCWVCIEPAILKQISDELLKNPETVTQAVFGIAAAEAFKAMEMDVLPRFVDIIEDPHHVEKLNQYSQTGQRNKKVYAAIKKRKSKKNVTMKLMDFLHLKTQKSVKHINVFK